MLGGGRHCGMETKPQWHEKSAQSRNSESQIDKNTETAFTNILDEYLIATLNYRNTREEK